MKATWYLRGAGGGALRTVLLLVFVGQIFENLIRAVGLFVVQQP